MMSLDLRRTKILATLGPATDAPDVLDALIRAGVNVVRMNFSHGTPEQHAARVTAVREAAARQGREVGILADLQGPKIRIEKFAAGKVVLKAGDPFALVCRADAPAGDSTHPTRVGSKIAVVCPFVVTGRGKNEVAIVDDGHKN